MRLLPLLPLLALAGGCNFHPASAATMPTTLPSSVTYDDQAGIAVETAYEAASLAERTAVKAGFVSPAAATKLAALDNQAYVYVCYTRTAYDLANGLPPLARMDGCPVATKTMAVVNYAQEARAAVAVIRQLLDALQVANHQQ